MRGGGGGGGGATIRINTVLSFDLHNSLVQFTNKYNQNVCIF